MSQPSFPASGPNDAPCPEDDWDADASIESLVAAIEAGQYELPPEAPPEQGLYVSLPPGQLTLEGFAQDGTADTMPPGALLATIVDTVAGVDAAGLPALSDDQLIGVISAARRLECRVAWTQLAAIGELATRRQDPARPDKPRPRRSSPLEFAADELAAELHLTWMAAANHISYACAVATRLPRSFAALAAGRLHPAHLRIIEDETQYLSAEDAAQADELLAGIAGDKTFAQLRYAARRLVLKLDPGAAQRRKDEAKQEACVRRFREASGHAGMIARQLPSDEVLASWQHIEQRALDLRTAGMPGTLQELRVRAYLDLLQERDSRTTSPAASPADLGTGQSASPAPAASPAPGDPNASARNTDPAGNTGPARNTAPGGTGPSLAALVTLTVPLATVLGRSDSPGEAGDFGPLDAQDSRDVVAAAARHLRTRWCVTALNPDGTAAAHACLPGRHPPPSTGLPADFLADLKVTFRPIIRGPCDHAQAEDHYRPSRTLAHLIRARTARCGCTRPAERCDLDHTTAWDDGGRTCPCGMAPLCRHHHRCKQARGWLLEQPEPGVMVWRTPAGRTYTTTPTVHSV